MKAAGDVDAVREYRAWKRRAITRRSAERLRNACRRLCLLLSRPQLAEKGELARGLRVVLLGPVLVAPHIRAAEVVAARSHSRSEIRWLRQARVKLAVT
jgi:hypothetical protein